MKIRLTILTENDKPLPDVPVEQFEKAAVAAWQAAFNLLEWRSKDPSEMSIVESAKVVKE